MEVNQRRYRRVQRDVALLENNSQEVPEISKQQLRKLLTERRRVIGPNGEEIYIPKHMAVEDIIKVMKSEYGLSTAEVAGILVALKSLSNNPEFRAKVNRVVVSGIETPLRIERPGEKIAEIKDDQNIVKEKEVISPVVKLEEKELPAPKIVSNRRSFTYFDENEYRRRSAEINAITADRIRAENAARRREEEARKAQNEDLERQLNEHLAQENSKATRRRRIGVGVAFFLCAMYVTGVIVDAADVAKQAIPKETNTPAIHETVKDKLFNVTPEVIAALSQEVTPIVTNTPAPQVSAIESVSAELNPNTNLVTALNNFSNKSENPVIVGNIASYQDFERCLENGSEELYNSGPAYFANFSRQVVHGMLKDKYGAKKVVATYEKKGENDQIYEFYIRYFKGSNSHERTPEGRVNMTRNSEGRLQTKEYHTLPYEVYEILSMIGEFSDYSNTKEGVAFDINGYAERFTDGDVGRAKQELRERMAYGTEALQTLIKDRVRDERVKNLMYSSGR